MSIAQTPGPDDARRLLKDLTSGALTAGRVAERSGMTLRELAQWSASPQNAGALDALRALADARSALVIGAARAKAARSLLRIAADREHPETARKACVDLLSVRPPVPVPADAARAEPGAKAQDDRALRSVLEKLGGGRARA